MNRIQYWDEQVSRVCLSHSYNRLQARVSRLISRTGDGPLYALVALGGLWLDRETSWPCVRTLLLAFARPC